MTCAPVSRARKVGYLWDPVVPQSSLCVTTPRQWDKLQRVAIILGEVLR